MRKNAVGQRLALLGNLLICVGLVLNGLEIISADVFRTVVIIAVIVDAIALWLVWKKSES